MKYLLTQLFLIFFLFSISTIALSNNPENPNKTACQIEVAFDYQVENLSVRFNNASIGDFDQIHWDFGDESYSKEANPTHTYTKEGMYEFCVTVINSRTKCNQQFCAEVYVFE